jgi:hypothetical protein
VNWFWFGRRFWLLALGVRTIHFISFHSSIPILKVRAIILTQRGSCEPHAKIALRSLRCIFSGWFRWLVRRLRQRVMFSSLCNSIGTAIRFAAAIHISFFKTSEL